MLLCFLLYSDDSFVDRMVWLFCSAQRCTYCGERTVTEAHAVEIIRVREELEEQRDVTEPKGQKKNDVVKG